MKSMRGKHFTLSPGVWTLLCVGILLQRKAIFCAVESCIAFPPGVSSFPTVLVQSFVIELTYPYLEVKGTPSHAKHKKLLTYKKKKIATPLSLFRSLAAFLSECLLRSATKHAV